MEPLLILSRSITSTFRLVPVDCFLETQVESPHPKCETRNASINAEYSLNISHILTLSGVSSALGVVRVIFSGSLSA